MTMAPRNSLSLKEKLEIIDAQEKHKLSVREIAKRFKIGKTTAAEITKHKDAIKAKLKSGININQKKNGLTPQGAQVDKLCYDWYIKARSMNIQISGPIVQTKAKEIAKQVEYSGFSASEGWLQKWRRRHNISFKCISGKASDTIPADENQFEEELPANLSCYKPADENCFFFPAFPDQMLAVKSEKCIKNDIEEVVLIHSDDELIEQPSDSIKSYVEALQQIARLKQFARHDFVAFQQLNKLEDRFIDLQSKGKKANHKRSTICEYFPPKSKDTNKLKTFKKYDSNFN